MRPWIAIVALVGGLYGAAGVALLAAGAHLSAGALATTAANFLLFHAAALVGLSGVAIRTGRATILMVAASLVAFGTLLFSGHLALHALSGHVPLPVAAPIGGSLTILGWLVGAIGLPIALLDTRNTR